MTQFNSELIKQIAVLATEKLLNEKVPLADTVAEFAAQNRLNVEQIKRCIEATNNVTQLKLMSIAKDRTFEFPLCKIQDVLMRVALPEQQGLQTTTSPVIEKAAGDIHTSMEKSAGVTNPRVAVSDHEAKVLFIKLANSAKREMDSLEIEKGKLLDRLVAEASVLTKDESCFDKIACVAGDDSPALFALLSKSGKEAPSKVLAVEGLFKEASLQQARTVADLYKQAQQLVAECSKKASVVKNAEALQAKMTKEAFLKSTAQAVGSALGRVAAAPITLAASGLKPARSAAKGALSGRVGNLVGAAFDASMYHPGFTRSGRPRDVWDALQSV